MTNYIANSNDSKKFTLYQNENLIGELNYPKWYTFDAFLNFPNQGELKFESKGFWKSIVELKDGETVLAQIQMGWKGIVIKLNTENEEQTYLLKPSGFMKYAFSLVTTDNEEILDATAKLKFKNLKFEYNFETTEVFEQMDEKELLLLVVLHGINYYLKMIAIAV